MSPGPAADEPLKKGLEKRRDISWAPPRRAAPLPQPSFRGGGGGPQCLRKAKEKEEKGWEGLLSKK